MILLYRLGDASAGNERPCKERKDVVIVYDILLNAVYELAGRYPETEYQLFPVRLGWNCKAVER